LVHNLGQIVGKSIESPMFQSREMSIF